MRNKIKVWGTVFFLLLGMVNLVMYIINKNQHLYSEQVLEKASNAFKQSLKQFLYEVDRSVVQLQSDFNKWPDQDFSKVNMTHYFTTLVNETDAAYGSVVFNDQFNYILFKEADSWVVTHDTLISDSLTDWYRYDDKLKELSNWSDTYKYLVDEQAIFNIRKALQEEQIVWRFFEKQKLDRADMIFCIFPLHNQQGANFVGALAFNLNNLSKPFRPLLQFVQPCVNIISKGSDLTIPVRPLDTVLNLKIKNIFPEILHIIDRWKTDQQLQAKTFSFEQDKLSYWTRVDTIKEICSVHAYALTLSNNDLEYANKMKSEVYLYLAILMGIVALAFLIYFGKPKKTSRSFISEIPPLEKQAVWEFIMAGESEFVEFKSSLRWDFQEKKVNKLLEDVIMKSIAAFGNAKGGTLLIGVADNHDIIGLEYDLNTLRKKNVDYFELHLRKLIINQYGMHFANNNLAIHFTEFDGKVICVIQIAAAKDPLYLSTKNKLGQPIEKFYVRSGNASQQISLLKEINDYVKIRFRSN